MVQSNTVHKLSLRKATETTGELYNPLRPLTNTLERILSTSNEESRIQKARCIMGRQVSALPDEELEIYITELQYLINEWCDDFERGAFDGRTLKQVLGQE